MADPRAKVMDKFFEAHYNDLFGEYGSPVGEVIVEKAEKLDIRVSTGAAVIEKESGGRNIFGCDHTEAVKARAPWCHERVTRERLDALIRWVESGEDSNGVGWAQLTHFPLIRKAEEIGGANKPGPNIEVGFEELKRLFVKYHSGALYNSGWLEAVASYNGGEGNRFDPMPQAYAKDVAAKARAWEHRLANAGDIEEPELLGVWGVPGGWTHWEYGVVRPPRYAPYQKHWGVDVAPGDVTPRIPHGPVAYSPAEGRWPVKAPLNGKVVRSRGGDQVGGFFNDTLIAYDTTDLDYPVDLAYVLYGHFKPKGLLSAETRVKPGDTLGYLGDKHRSLGEIIHTHVQVWWARTDALNYNHPTTKDPAVLWAAILEAK
jgi:murein DD-endopeptidase MepM/ murein hydrolase activator NlpD